MHLVEEFNSHKEECQRMAQFARDADSKATWKSMAERWERLAEHYRAELTKRPKPASRRRLDLVQRQRAA
jgi:hypothetical protein